MLIVVEIIGTHNRPCVTFFDCCTERGQIYFVKCAVIDTDIGLYAVSFMIVECEMLHTRCDTIGLHTLHIRHYHPGGKPRVFTHILKVSTIERRAENVDAGTEQHILFAVAGFLAYRAAIEKRHFGIPRCGQSRKSRKCHT